jgi:AcrR family transcriptional regulator
MPKMIDALVKRREIAAKAAPVFARYGIAGTNMGMIAEAGGMSRSNLYTYFDGIGSLLEFVLDDFFDGFDAKEGPLLDAKAIPALERLRRYSGDIIRESIAHRDQMGIVVDVALHPYCGIPGLTFDITRRAWNVRSGLERLITCATEEEALIGIEAASTADALLSLIKEATILAVIGEEALPLIRNIDRLIQDAYGKHRIADQGNVGKGSVSLFQHPAKGSRVIR